jgi:hypothetical protein
VGVIGAFLMARRRQLSTDMQSRTDFDGHPCRRTMQAVRRGTKTTDCQGFMNRLAMPDLVVIAGRAHCGCKSLRPTV